MSVPSEDMGSLADVRQLSRYVSVDLRADGFRERLDTDAARTPVSPGKRALYRALDTEFCRHAI